MCLVLTKEDLTENKEEIIENKEHDRNSGEPDDKNSSFTVIHISIAETNNSHRALQKSNIGHNIFKGLIFFYFLTMVFIAGTIIYILIFRSFNSNTSYVILVLVPSMLGSSLLMYSIKDWKILLYNFPGYIYYLPTYINILQIYAICQTDDVSWGTRTDGEKKSNSRIQEFNSKNSKISTPWKGVRVLGC